MLDVAIILETKLSIIRFKNKNQTDFITALVYFMYQVKFCKAYSRIITVNACGWRVSFNSKKLHKILQLQG